MNATAARFAAAQLEGWTVDVLGALGVQRSHAESTARVLLAADVHGVDSHGLARLTAYVRLIRFALVALDADIEIVRDEGGTVLVDAHNILGAPAAEQSMAIAIERARTHGVGWVGTTASNHFGIAGHYVGLAAQEGFVGLCGTTASALVAPTRSTKRFLGTNPIAFGAPSAQDPPLILDMATSAVAAGKFEIAIREGGRVPQGWGLDAAGRHTTDPGQVFEGGGALLPLGSHEHLGSYKGYGLALMVEVLSALLTGSPYGPQIGRLTSGVPARPAGVSHFFVALDPGRFLPLGEFEAAVARICADLRGLPTTEPSRPVVVPGEREWQTAQRRRRTGVPLPAAVVRALQRLGADASVPFPAALAARGEG